MFSSAKGPSIFMHARERVGIFRRAFAGRFASHQRRRFDQQLRPRVVFRRCALRGVVVCALLTVVTYILQKCK